MFKVGDKVIFTENSEKNNYIKEGNEYLVQSVNEDGSAIYIQQDFNNGVSLYWYNSKYFKLITKTTMSNVLDFFRNLTATEEEKLLKEFGLENPIGTPTEEGLKLSAEITYQANRKEVIEIAKKMKEAQKEEK